MDKKYEDFHEGNHVNVKDNEGKGIWKKILSINDGNYFFEGEKDPCLKSQIGGIELSKKMIEALGFKKRTEPTRTIDNNSHTLWIDFYHNGNLIWKHIIKEGKIKYTDDTNNWISRSESIIEFPPNNGDSSEETIEYSIINVHSLQNFLADNPNPEYGKVDFRKIYPE